MTIWKKNCTIEQINEEMNKHPTMMTHLGVECIEITPHSLTFEMPITDRVKQPFGLLHGGATAALAESVASMASYLTMEGEGGRSVGTELSVSHLKAVEEGKIQATALPYRLGNTLQVWEIRITNHKGDLIAISRLTTMVFKTNNREK